MISMTQLRRWHAYIGLAIAPSVLFFGLTGALQLFNLHEGSGTYQPPALLEKLSAVHKDQVFDRPHEHAASDHDASPAPDGAPPAPDDTEHRASTVALKWYFLAMSVGLMGSTLIGVWMGVTQMRRKSLAWTLLIAGTLIPIGLLAF